MLLHVLGHVHLTRQDQAQTDQGQADQAQAHQAQTARSAPPWPGGPGPLPASVLTRGEDTLLSARAGLLLRAAPGLQLVQPRQAASRALPVSVNQTVPVSGKAAALLTYLCLEGVAHHREHLAELLWDTPEPLRNLRVELARLKRDGVVQFPERQPMLSFRCPVDLHAWLAAAQGLGEEGLLPWLATLRGLPLSGLEDLGSLRYQQWLEEQRWAISEQVERALGAVHGRWLREHRGSAAARIQARAEQLNLHLTEVAPAPDGSGQDWQAVWAEQARLRAVLEQASAQPQLVLLSGRTGSGKRSLIRQSVQGSGWHLIQLQASAQRSLFQEALSQHLAQHIALAAPAVLVQPGPPTPSPGVPSTGDADAGLIELAWALQRSGLRLVIAVHHAGLGHTWLPDLARFLLDLPLPLVLILTETQAARLDAVREHAVFLDPQRSHRLSMTPLTPRMVLRAWQEWAGPRPPFGWGPQAAFSNEAHARAAQLIQRSEGWPLYAQELSRLPNPDGLGQHDLPEIVRGALLGELSVLPQSLRQALARLSLVHARIDPELAELLLGPHEPDQHEPGQHESNQGAQQTLMQGVQHGLLVPAAEHERALLPSLTHRSDDQTRWLQFGSEALRVALAGSLTGLERQELRQTLARHFLPTQPALSLNYALKAGLTEVAEEARQRLLQTQGQTRAVSLQLAQTSPAPSPMPGSMPRREVRTPNGYRVALDGGHLEVTRYGWYGPPPLLTLSAGEVADGPWSLTARLDVFRGAPHPTPCAVSYALGLSSGGRLRQVYLPVGMQGGTEACADDPVQFSGLLPLGEWFTLRGVGRAGRLELSVRALDVAFTIAALHWGGADVLPALEGDR